MMDPDYLKEIRVLVIDDDEDDWLITKRIFFKIEDSPFIVDWSPSYEDAMEQIAKNSHDIYLVDYRLGEHSGTDILERVHPETRVQPFILMTGVSDSDLAWRSLRLAAADYLVKGSFDAMLLSRVLLYALQRKYIEQQRIDQLVKLNYAKEEFISIASHQLRTPATGVKQYLGMVIEGFAGDVPEAQMELLQHAYESNERQLRIISDLLKVAQVDSGRMKLHPSTVDISEMVAEIVEDQRQIAAAKGQSVTFKPLRHDQPMQLDKDTFRMVFENIIDNARKYSSDDGSIRVEMKDDDNEVRVRVIDDGVGIDKKELHRLFEKFARINNPLSTKVGGSGLGLYWAKRIIDNHGGRIEYMPNKPKGSIFTIILPKHLPENSEVNYTYTDI